MIEKKKNYSGPSTGRQWSSFSSCLKSRVDLQIKTSPRQRKIPSWLSRSVELLRRRRSRRWFLRSIPMAMTAPIGTSSSRHPIRRGWENLQAMFSFLWLIFLKVKWGHTLKSVFIIFFLIRLYSTSLDDSIFLCWRSWGYCIFRDSDGKFDI